MNLNKKSDLLLKAFEIIEDGIKNRDSLFHTLTMSSFDGKNISSRVMVLRDFCKKTRTLRFHSDVRSSKVKNLKNNKSTSVIGYDPKLKTQIRFQGLSKVNHKNKKTKEAWGQSQAISKKCYSVMDGSSAIIKSPMKYDFHMKDIVLEEGYENFSTIEFQFNSLEFLYLQRQGHRRCRFLCNKKGKLSSSWLVP